MMPLEVDVVGIGVWSARRAGWPAFAATLDAPDGELPLAPRPSPDLLPPAERRRAPDGVAVALEVAREAVAMASAAAPGCASQQASVFASAHGDLAIVDYLCTTLATDPRALSPTKFHLSVHNAASGNWSIATRDRAPSSATAAGDDTFAAGLLDAATQAVVEERTVLFVCFDTPASGLLAHAVDNTALFGLALVLVPATGRPDQRRLALSVERGSVALSQPRRVSLRALASSSPAARGVVLAEALAVPGEARLHFPVGADAALCVELHAPPEE